MFKYSWDNKEYDKEYVIRYGNSQRENENTIKR